ncbi:MAG: beta keto-acyl synthase [Deltaproteobacteria bacterium]|nr:beta keto-acyl synthase [Deltaproteobacteria bacterium]
MNPVAPIAVVGKGCVLPGALTPRALGELVFDRRRALSDAGADRLRIDPALVTGPEPDRAVSLKGGLVTGFSLEDGGLAVPRADLLALDPLFAWLCSAGRDALVDAGFETPLTGVRAGAVLGNLSFPTEAMTLFGERAALDDALAHTLAHTLGRAARRSIGAPWATLDGGVGDARDRFMSGLPAHLLAQALALDAGAFCLDAACASSLYALRLAMRALVEGRADVMLAGAVNRADCLFLHVGFTALHALSPTGKSRPFDRRADGLVPAEGCALVALMRLDDAVAQGKTIHGVLRGIGLSNDGRAKNLLAPSTEGQVRALRGAWRCAGLSPDEVDFIECHATGTPTGDATELASLREVFTRPAGDARGPLPLGSLKGNLGHLITAAGGAGLLKVLDAMAREELPPNPGPLEPIAPVDANAQFAVQTERAPWHRGAHPRRAGLSAFGFGGNNAHLVVEQHEPHRFVASVPVQVSATPLAVVALATMAAREGAPIAVALEGLRFPPHDLRESIAQQLLVFEAGRRAVHALGARVDEALPRERTGVFVGMGTDVSVTTPGLRWRAPRLARRLALQGGADDGALARALKDAAMPPLPAQGVLGCMPNIPANRLNVQLDLRGPGFTVSAEERSGLAAIEVARALLDAGDIDAALVGATDACRDPRHTRALEALRATPVAAGDGAGVLVVMHEGRARALGLPVLALLGVRGDGGEDLSGASLPRFGDTHAARGLLDVALAIESAAMGALPSGEPWPASAARTASVRVEALGAPAATLTLSSTDAPLAAPPAVLLLGAPTRATLVDALRAVEADPRAATLAGRAALERGPWRAGVGGADAAQVCARAHELADALAAGRDRVEGALARSAALVTRDEVALLFGTAAGQGAWAAAELLRAWPGAGQRLARAFGDVGARAVLSGRATPDAPFFTELSLASAQMQVLAGLALDVLDVRARRAWGVSLGESNALLAAGAWTDMGALFAEMRDTRHFDLVAGGAFAAARAHWRTQGRTELSDGLPWRAVVVRAPLGAVEAALALDNVAGRAFLLVIHADDEVELGGAPDAVAAVLARLGVVGVELPRMPAVHCALLTPGADAYRALHRRALAPTDVEVWGHGGRLPLEGGPDAVADAILAQALHCVDVRTSLRRLAHTGARVLVDLSPRGLAGAWARRALPAEVEVLSLDGDAAHAAWAAVQVALAGVPINLEGMLGPPRPATRATGAVLEVPAHRLPQAPLLPVSSPERMTRPPPLPRIAAVVPHDAPAPQPVHRAGAQPQPMRAAPDVVVGAPPLAEERAGEPAPPGGDGPSTTLVAALAEQRDALFAVQQGFIAHSAAAHQAALAAQASSARLLTELAHVHGFMDMESSPRDTVDGAPAPPARAARARWGRRELERLASGRIADVWGDTFAVQDTFRRQVRMPEPPLLLADRVMSIDATPGVLEKDRAIVTETDLGWDAWYLHEGRCPAGVLIETGQADLLLVSYMGVDVENRGERVYRLLGCDLTYQAPLPLAGTTLQHDIHVDGYATHGDTRIFFFHSDTWALDEHGERAALLLSVRGGQAGFFTDEELAHSGGVLWAPQNVDAAAVAALPSAAPPSPSSKRALSLDELTAFARGDAFACFGAGFELAQTHVRTPRIAAGSLLLMDRVTALDLDGGPWGRGYLKAELDLTPDRWFFAGHFKDDPCMPGTIMFEGCLQTLAVLLGAAGFTLAHDGWRFEPAVDEVFKLRCRGQATPSSRHMVYEVFVRRFVDGPAPSITADILVTVDGLKSLHCEAVTLRLVCDAPLSSRPELLGLVAKASGVDAVGGVGSAVPVAVDQRALLATGIGLPSQAFPGMYEPFDGGRRVPRLPGPPYHFMSRVVSVEGPPMGSLAHGLDPAGTRAVVEYDVPPDAWFFDAAAPAQGPVMPFAVLLEVALQPCGWLSSYVGSALTSEGELFYRNLDGRGARAHRAVGPEVGTLVVTATLTKSSSSGGMIIQEFDFAVRTRAGEPVYEGHTVFGFFPPEALARQVGVSVTEHERARLAERAAGFDVVDLRHRPARYCSSTPALAEPMLLMIDRVTGYWPGGSTTGKARVRTEKDVRLDEWFFRAHFYQDPVQPGSLGLEAMAQAIQWLAIHEELGASLVRPRFAVDGPSTWKYRGQVTPKSRLVQVEAALLEVALERGGVRLVADCTLWVDGLKIYQAPDFVVRLVED